MEKGNETPDTQCCRCFYFSSVFKWFQFHQEIAVAIAFPAFWKWTLLHIFQEILIILVCQEPGHFNTQMPANKMLTLIWNIYSNSQWIFQEMPVRINIFESCWNSLAFYCVPFHFLPSIFQACLGTRMSLISSIVVIDPQQWVLAPISKIGPW